MPEDQTAEDAVTPAPDNRDPITDDPVMDEDHLDEALEESFPASDPLPVSSRN